MMEGIVSTTMMEGIVSTTMMESIVSTTMMEGIVRTGEGAFISVAVGVVGRGPCADRLRRGDG